MKKILVALMLLSTPAFAKTPKQAQVEAVISSIEAAPANGGINPEFAGVTISGTIFAGGNPCVASQYRASIKKSVKDGIVVFTPVLKLKSRDVICTKEFVPGFLGAKFSATFVLAQSSLETALVQNVSEVGNSVTLDSLLNPAEETLDASCQEIQTVCSREYNPTTCTYGDRSIESSNACVTRAQLQTEVCAADKTFDLSLLDCQSNR